MLSFYLYDNDVSYLWMFGCMFFFMLSVMLQRKRNNLRRIEEVDALLAERDALGLRASFRVA